MGKRTWRCMRNHAGYRPTDRRVHGGKRTSALKEGPSAGPHKRTFTSHYVLESLSLCKGVDCSFARQQPGFTLIFVVSELSPQKHGGPTANKKCCPSIRHCLCP